MIVWIASYPKSGNTWIRSLLSGYLYSKDGIFNFDLLKNIQQVPEKKYYDFFIKNPEDLKDLKKVSSYWTAAQDRINLFNNKTFFLKTHNALCKLEKNYFTNKSNTKAVIYVVRDPRNVITSLSHHYNFNLEEAFDFYTDKTMTLVNKKGKESVVTVLGDWSEHYQSWKKINFAPILIVKYEDLIADTNKSFLLILNFLKKIMSIEIDEKKILNTIESCNFDKLKKSEEKEGFIEAVDSKNKDKKLSFFNLGKKNNWKNLLDPKIEKKIQNIFGKTMKELNYI